ncbi:glycosyl hydrolase [Mucilaginibacter sp. 14171R-50]|uniref:glycoside hydrolase family 38 C-terminal domain-containing protein n=1 Tax=Mucilaginibacter sp. 14171R-50 TaxID=2703789 RepID=UPI00138DB106|nr:glycoside hydrolase family 38 C-terminal domain-containing protein [Mucilaginibacter sp. 14171R-50]QHS57509.1 glycosyl hydrolase [Mucilaginibacter sp. 14171R-50]
MKFKLYKRLFTALLFTVAFGGYASAQTAYYIDGYHGGIWGHYPDWNTRFMVDMLKKNPTWKINLELEPETWDRAMNVDPAAYADFKALFADQSLNGRIEYVNPQYAQSYNYNISGESIIRQFSYGMKMVRAHFPEAVFTSYSSEEPCFTSALPQILKSFGYKYASLKNPNTCWGGYTRSHPGELVNWIGPDGTAITTSPRYEGEKLAPNSAWQTIAWNNSRGYINAAFAAGMPHPVGMTLQDAGWKNGPFIGTGAKNGIKSVYTTWRNYFGNIAKNDARQNWKVSQEDMLVSLVWGSQVMQRIAQKVRVSENKLVMAEKMAAMAKIYSGIKWPGAQLDSAWRTLLLSQHHDCWIVPYNGKKGDTWADKVSRWTTNTNLICDSIISASQNSLNNTAGTGNYISVYNTTGSDREEIVSVKAPTGVDMGHFVVLNNKGVPVPAQLTSDKTHVLFRAQVPSMGYAGYQIKTNEAGVIKGATIAVLANGTYLLETDLYKIIIDAAHGGIIKSIIAKTLNNKQFVDQKDARGFNELRGNFYNDGGFKSTADNSAAIEVLEKGPLQIKLAIKGTINGSDYTQTLTVAQGQPLIGLQLTINWNGNPGIGSATPPNTYKLSEPRKAFYNDREKLLAYFPLNLTQQRVYKNAPFDVTESKLTDTFFTRWDSIKNNVLLNWVDVTDKDNRYGVALFTDHTTNYTHGQQFPLGLDIQYSGLGLWGRDHKITAPTTINYALVPHAGKWDKAHIQQLSDNWNEPLIVMAATARQLQGKSLISVPEGYEISSVTFEGNDMLVRLFNTGAGNVKSKVIFNCTAAKVSLCELDGRFKERLPSAKLKNGLLVTNVSMPKFGIRTIRLVNAKGI